MYADDSTLMRVVSQPDIDIRDINIDLDTLNKWAATWAVNFSPAKSKLMVISNKPNPKNYNAVFYDNQPIPRVDSHTHLGVVFSEHMSWENHIRSRVKKSAPMINSLKRMSNILPRSCKENIYKTFIRPILEYGCLLFNNCPEYLSDVLERCQRSVAISCTGAYSSVSHNALLTELGWPSLKVRREYYQLNMMYKIINDLTPAYLKQSCPGAVGEYHNYNLRNANNLRVPFARTEAYRRSFFPSGLNAWNILNPGIKSSRSLPMFKRRFKDSIFPDSNVLFSYGTGRSPVHQARMRMCLSGLNSHRKRYNFIDTATCGTCGNKNENNVHYLMKCSTYAAARTRMLDTITPLIEKILGTIINVNLLSSEQSLIVADSLLYGNHLLNYDENITLFKCVHVFIYESKRFV